MKTRSGRNYALRGLCVSALSAVSIGLLGLGLAQQSSTKLATADSALSSSVETAVRGGVDDDKAAKAGSSEQPFGSMAIAPIVLPRCIECKAYNEAYENIKLAFARFYVRMLGWRKWSNPKPPVDIGKRTRNDFEKRLKDMNLTPGQKNIVFDAIKFKNLATFDYFAGKGEPKSESEIAKATVDGTPLAYYDIVKTLLTDTLYEMKRRLKGHNSWDILLVERPISMVAMFRSHPFTRFLVFSLPYRIDEIAARFVYSQGYYVFDIEAVLPELQAKVSSPIPLTYVTIGENDLNSIEVKPGEKALLSKHPKSKIESSQVSTAKELAQVMEKLKDEAKIPRTHQLVVAYLTFLNPITRIKTSSVLCSDLTLFNNLQEQVGPLESADKFDGDARILDDVSAIYVDCQYSQIMQNHIVGAFNMLENVPLLDGKLTSQSVTLLDEMREAVQNVAPMEEGCIL